MTILSFLIWNLVAPAAISATTIALARRLAQAGWQARWGVAVGMGLGYLAGHWGILGRPPFPPLDANDSVVWLALAATALGSVEATWTPSTRLTWGLRAALIAGLLSLVLRSQVEYRWTAAASAGWLLGIGAAALASWWNLESQAERIPGPGWMFHLGIVAAGWAAVQVISGGASSGQLDGVLASTALGALVAIGLRPGQALSRSGPAVATTVLLGLALTGYFYSNVPGISAILLALAPWSAWVDRLGPIRRRSPWTRASVRVLAVLAAVGAAVLVAEAASRSIEDTSSI